MLGKGYGKVWVEWDVNTKRDPSEKYYLHAQTNFKMHVETFCPLKLTYIEGQDTSSPYSVIQNF